MKISRSTVQQTCKHTHAQVIRFTSCTVTTGRYQPDMVGRLAIGRASETVLFQCTVQIVHDLLINVGIVFKGPLEFPKIRNQVRSLWKRKGE